ncbi:MAG: amino acid permease [Gemmatimonadota bacterium]|jgi:APA family basic amino acid/polyamine antiporter
MTSTDKGLTRILGFHDLLLIVMGTVIGSGIFLVPGAVLRQTGGRVGTALLVWLLAGVLSLLGALTYGELGAMQPEVGGLYVYIRDTFGPLPAFLYGWTLFFVISSGSVATLAVAFAAYLQPFVALGPGARKLVAIAMVAVVAAVNVRGTGQSARVQGWSTGIKVIALLVMSALLLAVGRGFGGGVPLWPTHVTSSVLAGLGPAMVATLWAYEGWQYVTFSAGETRDPQRVFPRGIIAGTAGLIVVYLLANLGYVAALGSRGVAASDSVAAAAVQALFGSRAAQVVALIILIAMFSAANGLTLTATRVYYAMARDRLFFRRLAEVHPRFGTPAFAILLSSAWAMLLALTGTFDELLTYVVFTGWIFYALAALSIFGYRRSKPDAPRPFRVPGYPWTPILFVLSALGIVLNTLFVQPKQALAGIAVVLVGVPAFLMWRRRGMSSRPAADG